MLHAIAGAARGMMIKLEGNFMVNRGGAAVAGEIKKLDLAAADAAISSIGFGLEDSVFANVVDQDTNVNAGVYLVSRGAVADDAEGYFYWSGVVDCLVATGLAAGAALGVASGAGNLEALAAGDVCVGHLLEANSSGGTALRKVLFAGGGAFVGANPAT